jgi:2-polyprenyl-6-methoxyphenol hydroxylase-like FAD-dependent oxidoreductase
MRVAVVGSGIAGLAVSLVLCRRGHDVTILERAPEVRPVGSGLLLQPPGLVALERLGLLDAALACGDRVTSLDGRTRTGRRVIYLHYSEWSPEAFGLGMHRGALWHLLHGAASDAGISERAGAEVDAIEGDGPCHVRLSSRERLGPFDLVLIAAGSRSPLRARAGFRDRTHPYEWGAFYANVPMPEGWSNDSLQQRFEGTRRMMGILPSGRDASGAGPWLTLFWSERLDRMEATKARGWNAWREAALRLWPEATAVVERLRGFEDFTVAAYADVQVSPWSKGCVALIGDAAHGTSPQLGQGATLALLDALALERALDREREIPAALRRYEDERRAHAGYYQWASRMLTVFFQADGRALGLLRDAFMGPVGAIPGLRREFLATLTGHKSGILFGRLESRGLTGVNPQTGPSSVT